MLEIQSVHKAFEGVDVLNNVSLNVPKGDFFSIVGPSGCGKSTLLRIIAGLDSADRGSLRWSGVDLSQRPAHLRPFNMVFQRYALFPHMTVAQNVGFGPSVKGWPAAEQRHAIDDALQLVRMEAFRERRIDTLSGGQQQRVALARAIANKPEVLLLDEPMSALDQKLRDLMRIELLRIQRSLGITFILVTHDQEEALTMSDKIAIINRGVIEQCGSPEDIYRCPKTAFVANFVGAINKINFQGERLLVRPEDLEVSAVPVAEQEGFQFLSGGSIREILFKGAITDFVVDLPSNGESSSPVIVQKPSSFRHNLKVGDNVFLRWRKDSRFSLSGTEHG